MLEIKNISKIYNTEELSQRALDDVSITFRENEFVSVLGPSGSGKTTLLNIIGGLDHYDSGDLVINDISTKKYKDKDWDSYRNHRIGFVFQNYNLITHQTVLSNVELALTLSGVSKKERLKRAKDALNKVGLKNHMKKRPNQLSGGQMQRVAIARALVNNPDILLADEPTGALDSKTSEQIMKLLKEVAKDRLVIMVTHNPEIAEKYSTRIIKLRDGKVTDDTDPFDNKKTDDNEITQKTKKTSMSLKTALSLSLNNLMTKKGRTILTAFAGSIGIIGIALILSLSSGVNDYITSIQRETMLSYPITIESSAMDLTSFLETGREASQGKEKIDHKKDAIYTDGTILKLASSMTTNIYENNLTKFKKYLDNKNSEINKYVGNNGIIYNYQTKFNVFSYDPEKTLVNSNGSTFEETISENEALHQVNNNVSSTFEEALFTELLPNKDGKGISKAVKEEYEIVNGSWPKQYNEVVIIVDKNNEITATNMYYLGFLPSKNYKKILNSLKENKDFVYDAEKITYDKILNKEFYLLTESDYYIKKSNGNFESIKNNTGKVQELVNKKSLKLKVVGIIRQKEDSKNRLITSAMGYTKELTNWMIKHTDNSKLIKAQEASKKINVLNGLKFSVSSNKEKASEAKKFLTNLGVSDKARLITMMMQDQGNTQVTSQMMNMDEVALANYLDMWLQNPDQKSLIKVYDNYISTGSYDENMNNFGKIDKERPFSISIYADTFEDKDGITDSINHYNEKQKEEDKITYTDYVGLLMSSVTTIINAITYVLIAFVSISLVVSSIMIAIITYISVLERTKEIGILRAIGASKKDISRVFRAETFIEGAVAGVFGITITILLNIPINKIILNLTDIDGLSKLPVLGAVALIIISIVLTVIAGLIPSKMAAKKDPVEALRTE